MRLPLEKAIAETLGIQVKLEVSANPYDSMRLTPSETELFQHLRSSIRRHEWLVGRSALKSLLRDLGECEDTSRVVFPNRRFSLSHSEGRAVALGIVSGRARGVGVDFQRERPVKTAMARFYLTNEEQGWVMGRPESRRARELIRLWTIKEALFKANPKNEGTRLRHYRLAQQPENLKYKICHSEGAKRPKNLNLDPSASLTFGLRMTYTQNSQNSARGNVELSSGMAFGPGDSEAALGYVCFKLGPDFLSVAAVSVPTLGGVSPSDEKNGTS